MVPIQMTGDLVCDACEPALLAYDERVFGQTNERRDVHGGSGMLSKWPLSILSLCGMQTFVVDVCSSPWVTNLLPR
jgi:hypothetical protein